MELTTEQQDEIASLRAIFGPEEEIFDEAGGIMVLRVWKAVTDAEDQTGSLNELATKELPFFVNFNMVPTYPATTAPAISSVAPHWLPNRFKAELTARLMEIYHQMPSEPVIYRWWEFLNEANLVSMLEEHLQSRSTDAYARGLMLEPDEIDQLHDLHDLRQQREFDRAMHPCGVCLSEHFGRDMVRGSGACFHPFCRACMGEFCSMHIREGSVLSLHCPEPSCGAQLSQLVIASVVRPGEAERYEQLMVQKALDTMTDLVYCPRKDCNSPVILENETLGICPQCHNSFCPTCEQASHGIDGCPLLKIMSKKGLDKEQKGPNGETLSREDKVATAKKILSDHRALIQNKMLIMSTTRLCPNCKIPIEKNGGCDHMYCANCMKPFLWSGAVNPVSARKTIDLTLASVRKTETKVEELAALREIMKTLSKPCPGCNQKQMRTSTANHHHCSCGTSFCFLCGERTKGTLHFQNGVCKQHQSV